MVNDYVQSSLTSKTDGSKNPVESCTRTEGEGVGSLCQAESPGCSSCSGPNPARVPRPGRDCHSPAQNKGLHELPGSEGKHAAHAATFSPAGGFGRSRQQLPPPAGSSSSAPHPRLTAIDLAAAGRAQIQRLRAGRHTLGCCGQSPPPALTSRAAAQAALAPQCFALPRQRGEPERKLPSGAEEWREWPKPPGGARRVAESAERSGSGGIPARPGE